MPFTFSHPALVLPLACLSKRWFSLTGLIVGALVPDFEYFLRMRIKSEFSHTIGGLFWFDLLFGVLLAFLFHNIVRDSLLDNLPKGFQARFVDYRRFNWNRYFARRWYVVVVSVLIGAASHLLWDSFTHENGYFVRLIPMLSDEFSIFGWQLPVLKIVQHMSSLVGALLIIWVVYKLPKNAVVAKPISLKYWLFVVVLTLVIVALRLFFGLTLSQYGNLIVTTISALLISLILTPLILTRKS